MNGLSEDPKERAEKYIANFSKALEKVTMRPQDKVVSAMNISRVADAIQRYLDDARHYLSEGRSTTSLASITYAGGLLDALTFLELAQPRNPQ